VGEGGGKKKTVNVILTDSPSLVLSAQPDLHTAKQDVLDNLYNYFVTREDE
jgi:hypothetical protein